MWTDLWRISQFTNGVAAGGHECRLGLGGMAGRHGSVASAIAVLVTNHL